MTKNQIDYWALQETGRHNVAEESETKRHNTTTESETHRSNVVNERERERHNRADEDIRYEANTINREHFERSDAETERHNRSSEYLQAESNDIQRDRVSLGYHTAGLNYDAASRQVGLGYANLAETNRQAIVAEQLRQDQFEETQKQNLRQANSWARQNTTARYDAETRRQQANTSQGQLALLREKYTNSEAPVAVAQRRLLEQQAVTQQSTRNRMEHQNKTDDINAAVNVSNSASNWVDTISSAISKKLNLFQ